MKWWILERSCFYFTSSICHVHYIYSAYRSRAIIFNLPLFALSDATRTTQTWAKARSFIIRIYCSVILEKTTSRVSYVRQIVYKACSRSVAYESLVHQSIHYKRVRRLSANSKTNVASCQFHAYSFVETRCTKFPFTFDHCLWLFSFHC